MQSSRVHPIQNSVLNSKGQVAIFVALIFQVLFVFFAMIVNVGLVVHHKINLQNSVDIAAYYGAMKQAEMMNAIGHVNYQIRQAYKLMAFRYRVLGGAGALRQSPPGFPLDPNSKSILRDADQAPPYESSFCLTYTPLSMVTTSESYCQSTGPMKVPLPGVPNLFTSIGSIFFAFQNTLAAAATNFQNLARQSCSVYMGWNWIYFAKLVGAYKEDIRNRRKLILGLANEISQEFPKDIQGESIREGVFHTFANNLSYPNLESIKTAYGAGDGTGSANKNVKFEYINSLAIGRCKGTPSKDQAPGWLKEIYVSPAYRVTDGVCTGTEISFDPTNMNINSAVVAPQHAQQVDPVHAPELAQLISEPGLAPGNPVLLYRTMVGYEKDPWCVAYTGVSATATPKIPFSPFGDVKIQARAFAKPFGGRIGPWYGTKWPWGKPQSDASSNDLTDKLLPARVTDQVPTTTENLPVLQTANRLYMNHSRYLGDTVGINSDLTLSQFGRAIYQTQVPSRIDVRWFEQPVAESDFDKIDSPGDPLAWNHQNQTEPPLMRNIEIAAVAPDQFDTAEYSIDPDFYSNYLIKIQKAYGSSFQFALRGDLGSRMNGKIEQKRFSVRDQISVLTTKNIVDQTGKLTYFLSNFAQLLTSWQQVTPDQYSGVDLTRFGKCAQGKAIDMTDDESHFAPGSCKAGGRTGYSVKLVDGKFLRNQDSVTGQAQQYQLGGPQTSGQIDNPPPVSF